MGRTRGDQIAARARAGALLFLAGLSALGPLLLVPRAVSAQCRPGQPCFDSGSSGIPNSVIQQPAAGSIPGGLVPGVSGCAGGQCAGQFGGLTNLTQAPFAQQFTPLGGLLGQPASFLAALLNVRLFTNALAAVTAIAAQNHLQNLFGQGGQDILEVDPRDPRGLRLLRDVRSLRSRRGTPPMPVPGDFSVERLEQRGLVEEGGAGAQTGGPQQSSSTCPGGVCPVQPPAAAPAQPSVISPGGGCPGGVCPAPRR